MKVNTFFDGDPKRFKNDDEERRFTSGMQKALQRLIDQGILPNNGHHIYLNVNGTDDLGYISDDSSCAITYHYDTDTIDIPVDFG